MAATDGEEVLPIVEYGPKVKERLDALRARGEPVTPAAELAEHVGETVRVAGILVASRRAPTRENLFMEFLTLEDETGLMEVTLFPRAYQKFGHLIRSRGPFLVEGTVESQAGAVTLSARRLRPLPKPSFSPKRLANIGNRTV